MSLRRRDWQVLFFVLSLACLWDTKCAVCYKRSMTLKFTRERMMPQEKHFCPRGRGRATGETHLAWLRGLQGKVPPRTIAGTAPKSQMTRRPNNKQCCPQSSTSEEGQRWSVLHSSQINGIKFFSRTPKDKTKAS